MNRWVVSAIAEQAELPQGLCRQLLWPEMLPQANSQQPLCKDSPPPFAPGWFLQLAPPCPATCRLRRHQQPLQPQGLRGSCRKPLPADKPDSLPAQLWPRSVSHEGEVTWGMRSLHLLVGLHCSRRFAAERLSDTTIRGLSQR